MPNDDEGSGTTATKSSWDHFGLCTASTDFRYLGRRSSVGCICIVTTIQCCRQTSRYSIHRPITHQVKHPPNRNDQPPKYIHSRRSYIPASTMMAQADIGLLAIMYPDNKVPSVNVRKIGNVPLGLIARKKVHLPSSTIPSSSNSSSAAAIAAAAFSMSNTTKRGRCQRRSYAFDPKRDLPARLASLMAIYWALISASVYVLAC